MCRIQSLTLFLMAQSNPQDTPANYEIHWHTAQPTIVAVSLLVHRALPLVQDPEGHVPLTVPHRSAAGTVLLVVGADQGGVQTKMGQIRIGWILAAISEIPGPAQTYPWQAPQSYNMLEKELVSHWSPVDSQSIQGESGLKTVWIPENSSLSCQIS